MQRARAYIALHWRELLALTLAAIPVWFLLRLHPAAKTATGAVTSKASTAGKSLISYIPAPFNGGANTVTDTSSLTPPSSVGGALAAFRNAVTGENNVGVPVFGQPTSGAGAPLDWVPFGHKIDVSTVGNPIIGQVHQRGDQTSALWYPVQWGSRTVYVWYHDIADAINAGQPPAVSLNGYNATPSPPIIIKSPVQQALPTP